MPAAGPAGLLAFADRAMDLQQPHAGRIAQLLRRLGALWGASAVADIPVALNRRLSRTLGRLVRSPWRIELGPRALVSSKRLREVVTHEGAHAALAVNVGPTHAAPHGPEWRRLMALAGYPQATGAHWRCHTGTSQSPQQKQKQRPTPRVQSAIAYDHWCPVCHSSRLGRRPVKAWRCAACVAAGLEGKLEITRRIIKPTKAR
jgi:predicted SprT family Zn-dependent metalloprotease